MSEDEENIEVVKEALDPSIAELSLEESKSENSLSVNPADRADRKDWEIDTPEIHRLMKEVDNEQERKNE